MINHEVTQNLIKLETKIKSNLKETNISTLPKIIAVSKTFKIDKILPLISYGHKHYGENKVQEAVEKWTEIKSKKSDIKLHMIGKLQTNKVKQAVKLFDFIHSVDSNKLAKKIASEQIKIKKNIKIFIQVNIGQEDQKSGVNQKGVKDLVFYCKSINLDVIGLMCIPPIDHNPSNYFNEMNSLNKKLGFNELSMGMSSDYLEASKNFSTFLRIGSNIFGKRAQ
tara:strand:- start:1503 stop:2171 length:669 start_codon:yes stop_codon:yes gene_type:complete